MLVVKPAGSYFCFCFVHSHQVSLSPPLSLIWIVSWRTATFFPSLEKFKINTCQFVAHLYPGSMKGFSFVQLLMNYLFHMLIIACLKVFNTDCPTVLKKCFTNLYYYHKYIRMFISLSTSYSIDSNSWVWQKSGFISQEKLYIPYSQLLNTYK